MTRAASPQTPGSAAPLGFPPSGVFLYEGLAADTSLTLGGEYGGIGADYKLWSANATVDWWF